MSPILTLKTLHAVLSYDPSSGSFTWRVSRGRVKSGCVAGTLNNNGRRMIMIDNRLYQAHRLAWFYVMGKWPEKEIDHINGRPEDNRLENLRDVSHAENKQNRLHADCDSKTGLLGVLPHRNRFRAVISLRGKQHYLGTFDTATAAHAAYVMAKRVMHPGGTL